MTVNITMAGCTQASSSKSSDQINLCRSNAIYRNRMRLGERKTGKRQGKILPNNFRSDLIMCLVEWTRFLLLLLLLRVSGWRALVTLSCSHVDVSFIVAFRCCRHHTTARLLFGSIEWQFNGYLCVFLCADCWAYTSFVHNRTTNAHV